MMPDSKSELEVSRLTSENLSSRILLSVDVGSLCLAHSWSEWKDGSSEKLSHSCDGVLLLNNPKLSNRAKLGEAV